MFGLFWGDWSILILIPGMLFALWAQLRVKSTFDKYSRVATRNGMTAAEAARRLLDANGLSDVRIERVAGHLTDHYDPRTRVLRLSESVHDGRNTAAVGVACHEVGHAIQYAVNYAPVKIRTAIVPITNFGAKLSAPLIVGGLVLCSVAPQLIMLAYLGVACFGLSTLFQLVTLPTEFNASRRAMQTIDEMGILQGEELQGAKKVLSAAALTYVAALAVSAMQLLRFIIMVSGRRRD
jgi:Zn-dependent membrane protease YugP